eukprot:gnl/MRDRNA2_/MRDRNA2_429980_c0_seq1.p1 gnl/MRDRNA2_/MRDRNA2_429980_c0~~gnl/MRDRNA2_/MRDRNA2_429980_c0_seq1.p1  ORF type:complete len:205 (-),score=26.62 gnl/MRDRNA2_/MRDRNA2_429980_c0_seq1:5-529(-)
MVSATVGYIVLIVGATEMKTDAEFACWVKHLGSFARIPLLLALFSGGCFYLGVCLFFLLKRGAHTTILCVSLCLGLLFVPLLVTVFFVVRATMYIRHDEEAKARSYECNADTVYDALCTYFLEGCGGNLANLVRHDFIHQFSAHGETAGKIAAKIFDDWLEQKIQGMVRSDPGF